MTYKEYINSTSSRKHMGILIPPEAFKRVKMMADKYKKRSLEEYECFKRLLALYTYKSRNLENDLNKYFFNAIGTGHMDLVWETLYEKRYITTYLFPLEYVNPRKTDRNKFEKKLLEFVLKKQ